MYDNNNLFAKIIRNKISCRKVYEDKYTLIFHDIRPVAPIHLLAIPKGEFRSFNDFIAHSSKAHSLSFFNSIHKILVEYCSSQSGYRLVINHGKDADQIIEHFHIHIIAGKKLRPL